MNRRAWLRAASIAPLVRATLAHAEATAAPPAPHADAVAYPGVVPRALAFPRDHGSHPLFRTEWWYVTGWSEDETGATRGVQVTFFRSRPGVAEGERSAFAPVQLVFAHAAIADPGVGRLVHDQRAARAGFGLALAGEDTTDAVVLDWSLALDGEAYRARIPARDFTLDLAFTAGAPPLLQGDDGRSRKGPEPAQASYYYSRPQLALAGRIELRGRAYRVRGRAWLDHEWSSEYLAPGARGWDWTGIDLDDGGALMAFRIRDAQGAPLWAGGTLARGDGWTRGQAVQRYAPDAVRFAPMRTWRSPRTGIAFPVAMRVMVGDVAVELVPLFDDQELDARASVGTVYWEGAVEARVAGRRIGRGYLELTGYGDPLRM